MDFYHVLNRGIEKRDIVHDDSDRMRFVRSLYVLNDVQSPPNGKTQQNLWADMGRVREPLVHIHAWCLMKNHYHLLLSPVDNDSKNLSLFMKKLNMGYAKFYNEKYERSGYVWQGKYKKIPIDRDVHFLYIPYYIHLNPLDYSHPQWRTGSVLDPNTALQVLREYRWSSLFDYQEVKNFPSIITTREIKGLLGSTVNQNNNIKQIITSSKLAHSSNQLET